MALQQEFTSLLITNIVNVRTDPKSTSTILKLGKTETSMLVSTISQMFTCCLVLVTLGSKVATSANKYLSEILTLFNTYTCASTCTKWTEVF